MIIGISGKIGSGKDTIGKIIQYLIAINKPKPYHYPYTYQEFLDRGLGNSIKGWEIHKFADTLKDIVCLLINCTREQLEDHEFKNTELGEEWRRWYVFETINKGIPISKLFSTDLEALEDKQQNNKYISFGVFRLGLDYTYVDMTPRLLLQLLGTECGRQIIHPNIWINSLFSKYKFEGCKNIGDSCETASGDCNSKHCYPNWLITDLRFPNELKAIEDREGISIKINRWKPLSKLKDFSKIEVLIEDQNLPYLIDEYKNGRFYYKSREEFIEELVIGWREYSNHDSETALDTATFNYTIDNNGTIEELIEKVKKILIKENILCL